MAKIGKYEILEEIGSGAMGVVYKAYDPIIGRDVAIKVIAERVLAIPDLKERFYREARSVGQLYHENITIVHDVGEFEGKPYLVMEYLSGLDLHAFVKAHQTLPLLPKLDYARQICRGLQFAHAKGIIHRDIKPENVKVLGDGKIKIMDFGVARPSNSELTTSGAILGTPWYMSPEQVTGSKLDHRSDIFSFGVLLYELLVARKPFEGTVTSVIYKIVHEPPAPLPLAASGVAEDLQKLLANCLAKKPEARYRDCTALLEDLEALIAKARGQEQTIKTLLAQAETLLAQKKFSEASAGLDEILRLDETHPEANLLKQKCLAGLKPPETGKPGAGPMIGATISRYQIIAPLGAGGMGVVYKAEDVRLKRPVALKFLAPALTQDQTAKERFIREAQAASALDHPNICTIYEIDEAPALRDLPLPGGPSQLFISMAFYEGQTLKEKIAGARLAPAESVEIAIQIAQGLTKAHEHGIVHRDIKPANIMITKDGLVKILDFGLAKLTGATRITRSGMTAGTLSYMSPEQAQNLEVDHRSDVWSLGVILYQLATGHLPFGGEYELAILYSIVNEDPAPVFQLNSSLPAELEKVINRAMQKSTDERYAAMSQMLDELKNVQRRFYKKKENAFAGPLEEVESLLAKGKLYLERNEYNEAFSRFKAVLQLNPQNREAQELLTAGERRQKTVQQLLKLLPLAQKAFDKGNLAEARQSCSEMLNLDPEHAGAKELLEKIQHRQEQSETIEKLFADAEFYLKKEKYGRAEATYHEILQLDPANKDAERGLQKAAKGQPAPPPGNQSTAAIREMKAVRPPLPQRVNRRLIGLIVAIAISAAVVWLLWLKPEATKTADQPPAPSQPASAAKQELPELKTAAQQAGAERWALPIFQAALQAEQRGDEAYSRSDWAAAEQAYQEAAATFRRATEAATNNAAMESANASEIKESAAKTRQDMLQERSAAEKAGAKIKSKALFEQALAKQQEGNKNFDAGNRAGYLAAQNFFTEARDGYKQARVEAVALAQSEAAETARQEALAAKQKISGSDADKNANSNYKKAGDLEAAGQRQLEAGDFRGAQSSFEQAAQWYREAAKTAASNLSRTDADAAKLTMLAIKIKVTPENYSEAKYLDATANEAEAEKAYREGSFDKAAGLYQAAEESFAAVVREAAERANRDRKAKETARQEIQSLIDKYEAALEKRDLPTFTALFKNPAETAEKWAGLFKDAEEIQVEIAVETLETSGNPARADLVINMQFYNTRRNEPVKNSSRVSWMLEKSNRGWIISRAAARK